MTEGTNLNRRARLFAALATLVFTLAAHSVAVAQAKYKPGDKVECETTGSGKYWSKGTVLPFRPGDFPAGVEPDGSWYRVKVDANGVEYYCKVEFIRPVAGATNANTRKAENPTGAPREERGEQGAEGGGETASDVRPTLDCPVEQKPAGRGARPNAELFKKIIRCKKGEKSAENSEGTVTVDVSALQIGSPRPWSYSQDLGNAKPGATVYPVKATYTVKTHYGTATEVEENWIRIFNFYVNAFGEWQIGSEENVKSPAVKRIPKNR